MEHLQQTLAQVFERAPEAAGEIPR